MTITAKNVSRINVWPTYDIAREADTGESKFTGRMTVWRTNDEARANTTHEEEGGGGGTPAWVPANAKIHIDLVGGTPQGRAWVAGTGEVAVETLLGADPNTEGGWDTTEYDPAALLADGYGRMDGMGTALDVAVIGALRAGLLAGSTVVYQMKQIDVNTGTNNFFMLSADGGNAVGFGQVFGSLNANASSWGGTFSETISGILNHVTDGTGAINKEAITLTPLRAEFAVNGSTAVAAIIGPDDFPVTGDDPIVAGLFEIAVGQALQSITLYDPLPSTSGLSELSEVT